MSTSSINSPWLVLNCTFSSYSCPVLVIRNVSKLGNVKQADGLRVISLESVPEDCRIDLNEILIILNI